VVDANDLHEEYWRVNDVGIPYSATVTTLMENLENSTIEYWDYSRITKLDNVDVEQFLFVEMNKENGWFEIFQGIEIGPEQVILI
jgi:hypothetical protein